MANGPIPNLCPFWSRSLAHQRSVAHQTLLKSSHLKISKRSRHFWWSSHIVVLHLCSLETLWVLLEVSNGDASIIVASFRPSSNCFEVRRRRRQSFPRHRHYLGKKAPLSLTEPVLLIEVCIFQPNKFRQSHIFSTICEWIRFKFGIPCTAPKIKKVEKFQPNISTDSWENVHPTELLRLKNTNLNLKDKLWSLSWACSAAVG